MFVGIDVGGTNLKAGLVDAQGKILAVKRIPLGFTTPEAFAETLAELAVSVAREGGVDLSDLEYVGAGIPGAVAEGEILYTTNIPMAHVPLADLFRRYLDRPLLLGNDGDCAAVGEYFCGAGRGAKNVVIVTLGTGIGGGIIHNGKIYHGSNGMAGEVGHMSIEYNGQPCPCGRKGCWERYASATALKRLTKRVLEENPESILRQVVDENEGHVSGQSAFIAARRGDPIGQYVCDAYIDYLCAGIINLVNIFQPDTLAIGGGVSNEQDEQLLFPVRRIVAEQSIPCEPERRTRIVKAELGSAAGMIGAALLGKKKRI